MAALPQFYWMTVVAPILGFWYAFGIGANDCANSFATSVAAKSVSLRQAVLSQRFASSLEHFSLAPV
jgi:phosphate/sulfate permease